MQLHVAYLFLSDVHVRLVEFHFQRSLCSRSPFNPPNRYMQPRWATAEWPCLQPGPAEPCWGSLRRDHAIEPVAHKHAVAAETLARV